MKRILTALAVIIIATSLASCGRTKKSLTATETYSKDVQETQVAETITTTEKVDTLVLLKPDTSESVFKLHELVDSSHLVIDTPEQSVSVVYDPVTNKVRTKAIVKPRAVPVQVDRTTVIERTENHRSKSVQKDERKEEQVSKTPLLIPGWVVALLILILFAYVFWRTRWLWWPLK